MVIKLIKLYIKFYKLYELTTVDLPTNGRDNS